MSVTGHLGAKRSQVVKHARHLGHGGCGELNIRPRPGRSVAMLCHVHYDRLLPAEEEVPARSSRHHGQAKPRVVGHEHQHEQVGHAHLHGVEARLPRVRTAAH